MHDLSLITTISAAFTAAWVLGIVTHKLGLSPIVGYLAAGVAIGPYTPGFVGDVKIADQLSQVGVILLMFGVGLHFHLKDLLKVRGIAIPGAIVQSAVATAVTTVVFGMLGWPLSAGLMLGIAMGVASTVVLLRVLVDRNLLEAEEGRIAVGWLIVEDVLTVIALVLVPVLAVGNGGEGMGIGAVTAIAWAVGKIVALVLITLLAGSRIVPWILVQAAKLRSRELFTLTVLVVSVAVAVGSAELFGASPALGAFLAGMVVGQSPVSQQAATEVLPMRDAFAVVFFVSVGMLFDPTFVIHEPMLVAAGLGIVLIVKPVTALGITSILGYSIKTGLTVAVGLAQIGEFSFILAQLAGERGLLPEAGHQALVATAIISIAINPLAFSGIPGVERWLERRTSLWRFLNKRANRKMERVNAHSAALVKKSDKALAVIVGYGPVGRAVDALLRDMGMETMIVDLNMDSIQALTKRGRGAIYGDAGRREILELAGIKKAAHLVLALPHSENRRPMMLAAREMNPQIEITVRTRYLNERAELEDVGATTIVSEEGEAGIALAKRVLERRNLDQGTIAGLEQALRKVWDMNRTASDRPSQSSVSQKME
ncbi:MAG TPA: cation:proton antiporter [Phycisphaerales bacterium]|nr:cation:proton antiporter [Phycisphaerales bacterium]